MRSPAEILEAVADGYESGRYGWIQGAYERGGEEGGFCSLGAIFYEYRYDEPVTLDVVEVENALTSVQRLQQTAELLRTTAGGGYLFSIPAWNDAQERTKDEVIDTFKMAAKHARNQETP